LSTNKASVLKTYILQLLAHVRIFMNQLRDLLLKTLILFHKELVHCRQLSVDSLKPRGFLPLLITAPIARQAQFRKTRNAL
jgi:hypothetical protein